MISHFMCRCSVLYAGSKSRNNIIVAMRNSFMIFFFRLLLLHLYIDIYLPLFIYHIHTHAHSLLYLGRMENLNEEKEREKCVIFI